MCMQVLLNTGNSAKNRRLTPFPIASGQVCLCVCSWCVVFDVTNAQENKEQ